MRPYPSLLKLKSNFVPNSTGVLIFKPFTCEISQKSACKMFLFCQNPCSYYTRFREKVSKTRDFNFNQQTLINAFIKNFAPVPFFLYSPAIAKSSSFYTSVSHLHFSIFPMLKPDKHIHFPNMY